MLTKEDLFAHGRYTNIMYVLREITGEKPLLNDEPNIDTSFWVITTLISAQCFDILRRPYTRHLMFFDDTFEYAATLLALSIANREQTFRCR